MSELTKEEQRSEELTKIWAIITNIQNVFIIGKKSLPEIRKTEESQDNIIDIDDSYLRTIRHDLNVCIDNIDKLLGEDYWK